MERCDFTQNGAYFGSAICRTYGNLTLTECTFIENMATQQATVLLRGLDLTDTATVSNCQFSENVAAWATCIDASEEPPLTLTDSRLCDHDSGSEIVGSYTDGGGNDVGDWCCPGDIDQDGSIGASDLVSMMDGWDTAVGHNDREDVDRNDGLDVLDLLELLSGWGGCD